MSETLVQWDQVKGLGRAHLDELLNERRAAKEQIAAVQERVDAINAKILAALATADVKSVAVGETRVTLVAGGQTERLDKKKLWTKLLESGVKEKVLTKAYAAAMTVEQREAYVLVTEPKPEKK